MYLSLIVLQLLAWIWPWLGLGLGLRLVNFFSRTAPDGFFKASLKIDPKFSFVNREYLRLVGLNLDRLCLSDLLRLT